MTSAYLSTLYLFCDPYYETAFNFDVLGTET